MKFDSVKATIRLNFHYILIIALLLKSWILSALTFTNGFDCFTFFDGLWLFFEDMEDNSWMKCSNADKALIYFTSFESFLLKALLAKL